MDLLSHALVGGLAASVGLQRQYGTVASATMVAASLLPDLDGALVVLGPRYFFQYHRHPLTHSLAGAALLAGALTAVVCLATPLKRPALVFAISFGGVMLHVLADLLTPWPVALFYPFSARTYTLDLIHFLDPFLLAVLAVSLLAASRWPSRGPVIVGLAVLIGAQYLWSRAYARQAAADVVKESAASAVVAVLPHGLSPTTWDVIVRHGQDPANGQDYTYYVVDSLRRQVQDSRTVRSTGDESARAASRASPLVRAFLRRARFPVASAAEGQGRSIVEWRDAHLAASGGAVAGVRVVLDGRGQIVEERFMPGGRE